MFYKSGTQYEITVKNHSNKFIVEKKIYCTRETLKSSQHEK